ncbi:MAG: V-type ATP synthase subunit E family protein [Caldiserica bacterium]|nr:V-type ATP synthase subunit E family protein [Caldisericota bacterium]
MGTEELRAAVLQEATAEATALIEAATVQASQVAETQRRQLEEQADTRIAGRRALKDREVATKAAALKIEMRNAILKRKQELLEGLYEELEQRLRSDESLYRAYLERAVEEIGEEAPLSIECRPQDAPVILALLPRRADWTKVRLDAVPGDSGGGFIVHFAEAEIDFTLSAASSSLRERTLVEVSRVLFGDMT